MRYRNIYFPLTVLFVSSCIQQPKIYAKEFLSISDIYINKCQAMESVFSGNGVPQIRSLLLVYFRKGKVI